MDLRTNKILSIIFLSLIFIQTVQGNAVCDFGGGEPKWESAAFILAETIVGFVPEVGDFLRAFLQLSELLLAPGYYGDVAECVKTLIEQELDGRVINSTETFISYWKTTIAVWNDSALVSNTSSKAQVADLIWSEAFGGALDNLPNVKKKEQVMLQWLDIASSMIFIFESTAVQYTAHFGNGSKESCRQWKAAQLYTNATVDHIEKQMIFCPETCLNTSTFDRSDYQRYWLCVKARYDHPIIHPETIYCHFWVANLYNGSCNDWTHDCAWDHCQENTKVDTGTCNKEGEEQLTRIRKYVDGMKNYLEHVMNWLKNRFEIMNTQVDTWCQK